MSIRNTVLIYNPRAGKFLGTGSRSVERIAAVLRENGHDVTVRQTTGPKTAGGIARDAIASGAGLIVAAGGDGTINETAEGMLHTDVPLAILPAGTANVLACEMRLGASAERAAAGLRHCRPRRIAVGRLTTPDETRHFLMMAGIGLDAHIVYRVDAKLKARTGKFAYWVAGWSLVGRSLPEFAVSVDGQDSKCSFALVARVRNYGGDFEIARTTTLFDDQFEVVLFSGRNAIRYVKYFAGMAARRLTGMSGVTVVRAARVTASLPEDRRIYVQVDGELAGRLPVTIDIAPDALTLMIPPGYAPAECTG